MAYVGFDLDETLGRFVTPHYNTTFLQPHTSVYEEGIYAGRYGMPKIDPPTLLTPSLRAQMDSAFERFIDCLVEKERTGQLGILRPGIVDISKTLNELKQTGRVKSVVIYSNNGNLSLLHLAGRMIEKLADTPGLFCNYIHWFHPLRSEEVIYGHPGSGHKTIDVLKRAFQEGSCEPGLIENKDVYFIDDTVHPNIMSAIGPANYVIAPAYKFDADPSVLDECCRRAIIDSGLSQNPDYWNYVRPLGASNLLQLLIFLKRYQIRSFRRNLPNNTEFRRIIHHTFPKAAISRNAFIKALTTLRTLEGKMNLGKNLNDRERNQFNTARNLITQYESQHPNHNGGRQNKTKRKRRSGK